MARKRTPKTYEAPDMAAFMARTLRAMARRAAEGDLEALSALRDTAEVLGQVQVDAAQGAHAFGYSWTEIARELGISRQAARQRFTPAAVLSTDVPADQGDLLDLVADA